MSLAPRIQALQRRLGLIPDGTIGPATLTAIERALDVQPAGLTISRRALDLFIEHEVGSEATYTARYQRPIWPKGQSGVTVGIGYDLGYHTAAQIAEDWRELGPAAVAALQSAAGVRGSAASALAKTAVMQGVRVPFALARKIFLEKSLPHYARLTREAFPGVETLPADAQGALLSLVYNRGASMEGDSRREMRELRRHVLRRDLRSMADNLRAMKRLWEGKGLPGLLRRRDDEARLVEAAERHYDAAEFVRV